ncbi:TP901 family phage tail tape measure protein [Microbacterium proteolyticum]|uniref:TP901 family phage tail tape measure protein n=1 Tax=Microbacterium proteolyticum TaxID=1572644 RepID=A0A7W5CJ64_9MICO|nr:phage tail tape measure protein [Microbacterium proteolyticum]MBB3158190.1 TP901 family phage tail tape measure protein [Microbacterium proteolyticum]
MAGKSATDLIIRLLVEDESLDKVDRSKAKFDAWNDALGEGSKVAAGTLVAIGAAGVGASVAFAEAEAGVDRLAGSLSLTEEQAANAGEAAGNAYARNFGGSLEEVQAATAGVVGSIRGMRTASADEIQGITEKVLTLSSGFELEADRISQVVGQMLSTGLASSAAEGLDLLTATLQKVPPAVREDILDAVDEYGPFFQQIGMSGEEAMGALLASADKGMYGIDKTGDAVKEFGIRATDMSTTSVAAYEAAGLSASEMAAKILAGGEQGREGFSQVVNGLLGIEDPVARANAAIGLFGTPLEDLGVNEIPTFLESLLGVDTALGDVAGSADRMADTVSGNPKASWEQMQRTLQMVAVDLGAALLPAIDAVIGGLQTFADWASQNTGVLLAIGGVVGVIAAGIIAVSGAMKVYAAAQAIQTAMQWASNAAWLASPITWIVLAIIVAVGLLVAAGIWLWQNWGAVTQWLGDAWNWLWNTVLSPVFAAIGAVFTWLYQTIILPIVTAIMIYIGLWAALITWLWEAVVSPVLGLIGQAFAWLWMNVLVPVGAGIGAVINAVGAVFAWLWGNAIQPAVNGIASAVQWVYNSIISPVFNAISGAVDMVGNAFRNVFGAIGGFISNAFNGAVSAVRGPINSIIGLVNGAIRAINGISVTIPSWVPIVGGQTFGVSLPQVPYLATGGVTMGPMLAVVGDNPGGREYIEPVDKVASRMERVAIEASRGAGAGAPSGPMRIAREDVELLARLIGEVVYPLIVKGAQNTIKTAMGG